MTCCGCGPYNIIYSASGLPAYYFNASQTGPFVKGICGEISGNCYQVSGCQSTVSIVIIAGPGIEAQIQGLGISANDVRSLTDGRLDLTASVYTCNAINGYVVNFMSGADLLAQAGAIAGCHPCCVSGASGCGCA